MKVDRQAKILTLIEEYPIETQEELAEKLVEAGFRVTQATVSRDIRELRLTKVVGDNGRQRYAILSLRIRIMRSDLSECCKRDILLRRQREIFSWSRRLLVWRWR